MNLKHHYYRAYYPNETNFNRPDKANIESYKAWKDECERLVSGVNTSLLSSRLQPSPAISGYRDYAKRLAKDNRIYLKTTYPGMIMGSGYTHESGISGEFKMGFYFEHVTGMPTLPGSSVKGILRSVFPSYKKGNPEKGSHKQHAKAEFIASLIKGVKLNDKDRRAWVSQLELQIFGETNSDDPPKNRDFKRDVFFDAQIVDSQEENKKILDTDYITPHKDKIWKEPVPLMFLKVRPNVIWEFAFKLHPASIDGIDIESKHKLDLFRDILLTIGAGAKTNVGYGQFDEVNGFELDDNRSIGLYAEPIKVKNRNHNSSNTTANKRRQRKRHNSTTGKKGNTGGTTKANLPSETKQAETTATVVIGNGKNNKGKLGLSFDNVDKVELDNIYEYQNKIKNWSSSYKESNRLRVKVTYKGRQVFKATIIKKI